MNNPSPPRRGPHRLAFAIVGSLIVGFLLPLVFVLVPAGGTGEGRVTGAALLGWGIGWAMLAGLSIRFTREPQRWAFVPAVALGVPGLILVALAPGDRAMEALAWLWPVPVLVLAAWLLLRARRNVPGASRRLLYPVIAVLALLAVGGGAERLVEAVESGRSPADGELVEPSPT